MLPAMQCIPYHCARTQSHVRLRLQVRTLLKMPDLLLVNLLALVSEGTSAQVCIVGRRLAIRPLCRRGWPLRMLLLSGRSRDDLRAAPPDAPSLWAISVGDLCRTVPFGRFLTGRLSRQWPSDGRSASSSTTSWRVLPPCFSARARAARAPPSSLTRHACAIEHCPGRSRSAAPMACARPLAATDPALLTPAHSCPLLPKASRARPNIATPCVTTRPNIATPCATSRCPPMLWSPSHQASFKREGSAPGSRRGSLLPSSPRVPPNGHAPKTAPKPKHGRVGGASEGSSDHRSVIWHAPDHVLRAASVRGRRQCAFDGARWPQTAPACRLVPAGG